MSPHERMNDLQVLRWYEVARKYLKSAEREAARVELERRVKVNGGSLFDMSCGVCYVWSKAERSLVRRELIRHRKQRTPAPHEPRIGTVVLATHLQRRATRGRRGRRQN